MQNNDFINKLKYLKHKSRNNLNLKHQWQNFNDIDFNDIDFNNMNIKCFYKFRLLYNPSSSSSTPSNFLNKTLAIGGKNNYYDFTLESVKLLAFIEH